MKSLINKYKLDSCFVAGKFIDNANEFTKVNDKYSGEYLSQVPMLDENECEKALNFSQIRNKRNSLARKELLEKVADRLEAEKQELAMLICQEAGKPISYAENEVERAILTTRASAAYAITMEGESLNFDMGIGIGKTGIVKPQAIGTVLCITPFNFPLNLLVHKVAPALAVGCNVIIKASPRTPLSAIYFTRILLEVGFNENDVQLLNCSNQTTEKLVSSDKIAMVSFTGSDKVGWRIKSLAKRKVTLELGGDAPLIVDESCDLDEAVKQAVRGTFLYAGQICISTQRLIVQSSIYNKFKELLIEQTSKLAIGDPKKRETICSSMIDLNSINNLTLKLSEVVNKESILIGNDYYDIENNVFLPTIVENPDRKLRIYREEAFAPYCSLESYDKIDEAISIANNTHFGLQVGFFSNNLVNIKYAFENLEYAGIIVNSAPGFRLDTMPYGGIKKSGFGREGVKYAMEEMTEPKLLVF